ncbi:MAG: hypothetical protein ACI92Z_001804 [Paracoccaceae bacterium]|jgi:hypothetical protein
MLTDLDLPQNCEGRAEVKDLSPHQAGRHGFYTELRVRQGVDPVTTAPSLQITHKTTKPHGFA